MDIIAKSENGYLISATTKEVQEILRSVNGQLPDNLDIGQKIPAIDYASTITKIRQLEQEYSFKKIYEGLKDFNETANN